MSKTLYLRDDANVLWVYLPASEFDLARIVVAGEEDDEESGEYVKNLEEAVTFLNECGYVTPEGATSDAAYQADYDRD
jgi:hypothetical protein